MKVGLRRKPKLVSGEQAAKQLNSQPPQELEQKGAKPRGLLKGILVFVAVAVLGAGTWFGYSRYNDRSERKSEEISTPAGQVPAINDFSMQSPSELLNSDQAALELINAGMLKLSVQKYQSAYEYYKAALEARDLTPELKESALIGIMRAGIGLGDKQMQESVRQDLGEELYSQYSTGAGVERSE